MAGRKKNGSPRDVKIAQPKPVEVKVVKKKKNNLFKKKKED